MWLCIVMTMPLMSDLSSLKCSARGTFPKRDFSASSSDFFSSASNVLALSICPLTSPLSRASSSCNRKAILGNSASLRDLASSLRQLCIIFPNFNFAFRSSSKFSILLRSNLGLATSRCISMLSRKQAAMRFAAARVSGMVFSSRATSNRACANCMIVSLLLPLSFFIVFLNSVFLCHLALLEFYFF